MSITTVPDIGSVVLNGEVPLSAVKLTAVLPSGTYDFSDCISALSWDEAPSSNLPDGIPAEDGETARTGSLSLFGSYDETDETKTVFWLLNPDNAASPMYRQELKGSRFTLEMGVPVDGADVYVQQWAMIVASVDSIDPLTGVVSLQLADDTDRFADMSNLPSVLTDEPYNAGLTSEFVLDLIPRVTTGGEYSTWPALRSQCVLAVGMRTSVWPEVGALTTNMWSTAPTFAPGVFGSAFAKTSDNSEASYSTGASGSATELVTEFWVTGSSGAANVDCFVNSMGGATSSVQVTPGSQVFVYINSSNALATDNFSTPISAGPHYVGVHVHFAPGGGSWSVDIRIDGTTTSSGTRTLANLVPPPNSPDTVKISSSGTATIEAVQVTTESAPAWNDGFSPKVILDPSLNPMQAIPAIDTSRPGWDEMQTAAQAECGFLYLDNTERLIFRNRDSIDQQTAWRAFTSDQSLESLTTRTGATTKYQRVAIDYTDYAYTKNQTVLSPVGRWKIPAHSTRTWTKQLASGSSVAGVSSPVQPWTTDAAPPPPSTSGQSYYRASLDKYGANGEHPYMTLTVTVTADTPSQITVTATNRGAQDAWLVEPSGVYSTLTTDQVGTAALWVRGTLVTADSPTTIYASVRDGSPTFTFDSNPYRQDRDAAQALAKWLLGQTYAPYPQYGNVGVMFDPRLVVSDRVTITDPDVSLVQTEVTVWGRHVTIDRSGDGLSVGMTLDVRPTSRPGSWVLGDPARSQLGSTTYIY